MVYQPGLGVKWVNAMRHEKKRLFIAVSALLLVLSAFFCGCNDEKDLCREFCRKAAECLGCGGTTADIDGCKSTCVSLSVDEKKALSDCAADCPNMRACQYFMTYPNLNPCR